MVDAYGVIIWNIRRIIEEKGMKQGVVAERSGFTPQEFSNILNDRRKLLRVEHIPKVAKALGVTPDALFANPSGEAIAGE